MKPDQGSNNSRAPLDGIRVLELGQNVAGPYAGAILSSLGAEVIKIERPGKGDDSRSWTPSIAEDSSTFFEAMNRGKRSVVLDLDDPSALSLLRERIHEYDVLVHNMRPGVMERVGLGSENLCPAHPRLIYCALSAFGHKGPLHSKPGYEPIVQAFSGIFSVNGSETGPGVRVGLQVLDLGTGVWGALGCIAALFRRATTGVGGVVEASLFETALGWLQLPLAALSITGQHPKRHSSGTASGIFQAFDTSDGQILVVAANDRLFVKLMKALGRPDLAIEQRFATNALRVENREELIQIFQSILKQNTMGYWIDVLENVGVPCSPIHDLHQVLAHPHAQAIEILQDVPSSKLRTVGLPLSLEGKRPLIPSGAPKLGEYTSQFRNAIDS